MKVWGSLREEAFDSAETKKKHVKSAKTLKTREAISRAFQATQPLQRSSIDLALEPVQVVADSLSEAMGSALLRRKVPFKRKKYRGGGGGVVSKGNQTGGGRFSWGFPLSPKETHILVRGNGPGIVKEAELKFTQPSSCFLAAAYVKPVSKLRSLFPVGSIAKHLRGSRFSCQPNIHPQETDLTATGYYMLQEGMGSLDGAPEIPGESG